MSKENLVREVINLGMKIRAQKYQDKQLHPAYADALLWLDKVEDCLILARETTKDEYLTRFDVEVKE